MPRIAAALAVVATLAFCIGFNVARYPAVWEMAATGDRVSPSGESVQSTALPQPTFAEESQLSLNSDTAPEPSANTGWKTYGGSTAVEPIAAYPGDAEGHASPAWTEGAPVVAAISSPPDDAQSPASAESPEQATPPSCTDSGAAVSGYQAEPSDSPPAVDRPRYPEDVIGYPTTEPIEVLPSMKYASSAAQPPAGDPPESYPSEASSSERPLVPVTLPEAAREPRESSDVPIAGDPQGPIERPGADAMVQRLPAIDDVWTDPAANREPLLPESPIPIYPTTGIE